MTSFRLICTTALLGFTFSSCVNAQVPSSTVGTITIREKDPEVQCSIPTTVGDHSIKESSCTNDQAYSIRFDNVPSALNITFYDDERNGKCPDGEGWEIEVRTTKNPTTMDPLEFLNLEAIAGAADGSIIRPGVRKVRYRADGSIHGKLSCIRIENHK